MNLFQKKLIIGGLSIIIGASAFMQPWDNASAATLKTPYGCNTRPTLRIGSSGECVKATQYILNAWSKRTGVKITPLSVTGYFGSITSGDVKIFQAKNGISSVGYVGPKTWAALEKESAMPTSTPTPTPTPTTPPQTRPTTYSSILNPQSHAAFPAAAKLSDGRIMTVFRSATQHVPSASNIPTLYQTFSYNNGTTWTKPTKIALKTAGGSTLTPYGVSDPGLTVPTSGPLAGRPILTYFEKTPGATTSRIVVANDKNASSWGVPQQLNLNMSSTYISAPAVQLSDTTFIAPAYGGIAGYNLGTRTVRLTWNGTSFTQSDVANLALTNDGRWFTEPNITKTADGRLMALIRTDKNTTQARTYKAYSSDQGKTWTTPTVAFDGWGNPHVTKLTSGKLVATYRHALGTANPPVYGQLWAVYRTSSNNGASWSSEVKYGATPGHEMAYSVPLEYSPNKIVFIWGKEDTGYVSRIVMNYASF